jgi:hypothetical protein
MNQKLENIMPLVRGKVVTLSFWAKATSGGFSTAQYMETTGGVTYHAQSLGTGESLTSTWTRYFRTFTVSTSHDINAKACGIRFDTEEGVANDIYITGVQLEVGSVATDFEHRSYGEELALCQRYYQEIIGSSAVYTATSSGGTSRINGMWSTTMRATPTTKTISTGWSLTVRASMYEAYYSSGSGDHTHPTITADAEL